jgi:putative ABC transport system permease protein
MIRHAFKLIWNRRRANALMLVELLVSFLVLSSVLSVACYYLDSWRQPLGFEYENVWQMDVRHESFFLADEGQKTGMIETTDQLLGTLRGMPEVDAVSPLSRNTPFVRGMIGQSTLIDGSSVIIQWCEVEPEAMQVLDFEVVAGRWIEPGDEELNWVPNVITRNLAEALFGNDDPVGKSVPYLDNDGEPEEREEGEPEHRIVGVISAYRRYGELTAGPYSVFMPMLRGDDSRPTANFVLKLREGIPATFEEELMQAAHDVAPDWSFAVTSLEVTRRRALRDQLLPLMIGATVAGFLIAMVGMGLVGVLWQNVARRTGELGLRRALGATGGEVKRQILFELLALTTLAIGVGALLFIQVPILQVFGHVSLQVFLFALCLSLLLIYLFVTLCGLYPSWLATRVSPVEALQHE